MCAYAYAYACVKLFVKFMRKPFSRKQTILCVRVFDFLFFFFSFRMNMSSFCSLFFYNVFMHIENVPLKFPMNRFHPFSVLIKESYFRFSIHIRFLFQDLLYSTLIPILSFTHSLCIYAHPLLVFLFEKSNKIKVKVKCLPFCLK